LVVASCGEQREVASVPQGSALMLRWLMLAAGIVTLDQVSKDWILGRYVMFQSEAITPFFNLVLVMNSGAAFSFLAGAGGWQKWFFIVLAVAVSIWLLFMLRQHASERLLPSALATILGGAIGNLIDRLRFDAVVDFLDFHFAGHHFPAFNVADSAITIGVSLMLIAEFRRSAVTPK
jgi:signal peptidase II